MKEAAGEANLTVVAIILIGVIAAVVTPIITSMMTNTARKACCSNVGGVWSGNNCVAPAGGTLDQTSYNTCVTESKANR